MQYKICRNCKFQNEYSENTCSRCGLDLMDPSHFDIESDGSAAGGSSSGGGEVIRLWSVEASKFLTLILTVVSIGSTVFVVNNYFGKEIRESIRQSEAIQTIIDKMGIDMLDLNDTQESEPYIEENQSDKEKSSKDSTKSKKNKKKRGYVLKNSSKEYISMKKLNKLSKRKLAIARNEIFARNGYTFEEKKWKRYFTKKSWYEPEYSSDYFNNHYNNLLNKYEKKNVQRIKKAEKKKEG